MRVGARILREFYGAGVGGVGFGLLCERLGLDGVGLLAGFEGLRGCGFEVEVSPHGLCRLAGVPSGLVVDDVLARLGGVRVVGREVEVFGETGSTNELVWRLGRDGVEEGVVVLAEFQRCGRGRLGRGWFGAAGKGVLMSVLLRPCLGVGEVTRLTVAGAAAVVRAVERCCGLECSIKWPNDVLFGGRKLGGILSEVCVVGGGVGFVVLGVGLNVNEVEGDFPGELCGSCVSLRMGSGGVVCRAGVVAALLEELDWDYGRVLGGRFGEVAAEWEGRCSTLGCDVVVGCGAGRVEGRAEGVDGDGALLVRRGLGGVERVVGGEVSLVCGGGL